MRAGALPESCVGGDEISPKTNKPTEKNKLTALPYLYHTADLPSSSHSYTATACCRSRAHSLDRARSRHRIVPASRSYTCQSRTQTPEREMMIITH